MLKREQRELLVVRRTFKPVPDRPPPRSQIENAEAQESCNRNSLLRPDHRFGVSIALLVPKGRVDD